MIGTRCFKTYFKRNSRLYKGANHLSYRLFLSNHTTEQKFTVEEDKRTSDLTDCSLAFVSDELEDVYHLLAENLNSRLIAANELHAKLGNHGNIRILVLLSIRHKLHDGSNDLELIPISFTNLMIVFVEIEGIQLRDERIHLLYVKRTDLIQIFGRLCNISLSLRLAINKPILSSYAQELSPEGKQVLLLHHRAQFSTHLEDIKICSERGLYGQDT